MLSMYHDAVSPGGEISLCCVLFCFHVTMVKRMPMLGNFIYLNHSSNEAAIRLNTAPYQSNINKGNRTKENHLILKLKAPVSGSVM